MHKFTLNSIATNSLQALDTTFSKDKCIPYKTAKIVEEISGNKSHSKIRFIAMQFVVVLEKGMDVD